MNIQNIYDNPIFFEEYKKLRQNDEGFNNQVEQPSIRSLLPDVQGKTILDIGCGLGNFCHFLSAQKVKQVIGLDPSEKMIAEAERLHHHPCISYQTVPIEKASFENGQFDHIGSSLALHYVEDYAAIVEKISRWLKPNGYFIFSVEHPICTANPHCKRGKAEDGMEIFPVCNYRDEGLFEQTWFIDGVQKYHRTISTYINTLLESGFAIDKILEPMPTEEMIKKYPTFAVHKIRPPLLVIKAQRF